MSFENISFGESVTPNNSPGFWTFETPSNPSKIGMAVITSAF